MAFDQYELSSLVSEHYDTDPEFASELAIYFPDYEYPDFSWLTIRQLRTRIHTKMKEQAHEAGIQAARAHAAKVPVLDKAYLDLTQGRFDSARTGEIAQAWIKGYERQVARTDKEGLK